MIKAIIFDQDGTFYPKDHKLTLELRRKTKKWISEKLNKSDSEVDELYSKLPIKYPNPLEGYSSIGLDIKE